MYHYIKGLLIERHPTFTVIEAGGVGYHIFISLHTYTALEGLKEAKLLTHFIVKEDGHILFGFATEEERQVFVALISVNGVGPNTARLILSSLDPASVKMAVLHGDVPLFNKIKGIGPKTAQRIIIDLKDKFGKDSISPIPLSGIGGSSTKHEALQALLALGFGRVQIENVLNKIPENSLAGASLEDWIKSALKNLS